MTSNPSLKAAIRARVEETGEPYVLARRYVLEHLKKSNDGLDIYKQILPYPPKLLNALAGQKTLAFTSGTRGVGKTITALCVAGAIVKASLQAGKPKKVVVLDLDTRDGKIGSLLGQYMPTAVSIKVMPTLDSEVILRNLVHDKNLGIDALLAPVRPRNAGDVGPDFYYKVIQILQTTHDVVILNLPSDLSNPLVRVGFNLSDEILMITTVASPSVEAMARSLADMFADVSPDSPGMGIQKAKVGIVANMVINNAGMGKDKLIRAGLGAPLVGQIPAEYKVVLKAVNDNKLSDLLDHERLGAAYSKIVKNCFPEKTIKEQRHTNDEILIGYDNSENQVYWKPESFSHLLVAGKPGSGKTYFLKNLIKKAQAEGNLIGWINLYKHNELKDNLWGRANDKESAFHLIEKAEQLMQSRYNAMNIHGASNYKAFGNTQPLFLVIDEFASLIESKGDKAAESNTAQAITLLESISRLGRAAGIHLVIATQNPESIPEELRWNLDARLALGDMSDKLYESTTGFQSKEHLQSWESDIVSPVASSKRRGEGIICLGNDATKVYMISSD